jgi:hypothetical protein
MCRLSGLQLISASFWEHLQPGGVHIKFTQCFHQFFCKQETTHEPLYQFFIKFHKIVEICKELFNQVKFHSDQIGFNGHFA